MTDMPIFHLSTLTLAKLATLAAMAAMAPGSASAQTLVGLTSANQITRFDAATPQMASTVAITGLAAGDRFIGIDLRPTNNTLYGITLSNQIYTIDEFTGAATFVATLSMPVVNASLGWGFDFNPAADYAGGSSLRLTSSAGSNFAINAGTGVVGNAASNIGGAYTSVAYTNSSPAGAPASTQLYYIDTVLDTLNFTAGGFNAPTISTVGPLGVDAVNAGGFDITADGRGFAALNLANSASLATGIYSIDLATGAATLTGTFNGTLSGLTVSAVPEPGTYGLLAAGLGVIGWVAARRRKA